MIRFVVHGKPATQGSKRVVMSRAGRPILLEDAGEKWRSWRAMVTDAATRASDLPGPLDGPVGISLDFYLPRPKGHWRTGRNSHLLRDSAPTWHSSRPDIDKLARAILDALSGVIWQDDGQVASIQATTRYDGQPRVEVAVWTL